jgi:hypothetical protein
VQSRLARVAKGTIKRAFGGSAPATRQSEKAYEQPPLMNAQQRALDSLRDDGIAIVPFSELFGDDLLWEQLRAEMDAFVAEASAQAERGAHDRKKDFLIRRYPRGKAKMPIEPAVLPSDGPWLRFAAGDALLDIVNSYRKVKTKLVDFDLWYTIPTPAERGRRASQQWHRDPEDQHVVKTFLYFSDVDENAGPFEYVRRSAAGGKYGDLWPWGKEARYPPSDELEKLVDTSDIVLATGTGGTLVICDTSGFHRGGYVKTTPRILATQTYIDRKITPDKPNRRKFQVEWQAGALSEQARFALS